MNLWRPIGIIDDFNLAHGSTSALGRDTKRLEDGFLGGPASSKRRPRVRRPPAVSLLALCKVARDELLVVDVDGVYALDVDAYARCG